MIPFPEKKYNIIYADPAWNYENWGEGASRNVKEKYKTMSMEEIWKLPIKDISDENCILFLWVTYPKLIDCIKTIKEWGFTYKTCAFSWIKKNKKSDSLFWGMGYWTRANNEICLLATKGKPKRVSMGVHQIVYEPIREHSRKPDCVRDRIVELCGDLPRIELFARQKVDGWDCWGNEV
ncbi:transcriptional activator [uncultured Mediterranean phage]|nr:transcriptional activator [uncultured Mediterranean phage]